MLATLAHLLYNEQGGKGTKVPHVIEVLLDNEVMLLLIVPWKDAVLAGIKGNTLVN